MLTWTLITLDWTLRITMCVWVLLRKKSADAMPWLLVCALFPLLGLFLYLLIGGNRLGRRRSRQHARAMRVVDGLTRLGVSRLASSATVLPHRRDLATMAEALGHMPIVGGNHAEIIAEPTDYLNRLVEDIDNATSYIHCIFYIFEDDRAGREVGAALERAAARGVCARLLVDAVGSRLMLRRLAPRLRQNGVQVSAMLPVNPLRRRLARIDLRNHRKLVVVDGVTLYTGSQNIVDPSMGENANPGSAPMGSAFAGFQGSRGSGSAIVGSVSGSIKEDSVGELVAGTLRSRFTRTRKQWDDLNVRLKGPIAVQGDVVFLEDWYSATGQVLHEAGASFGTRPVPLPERHGEAVAQLVPSGPTYDRNVFHNFMIAALHDAEKRIELCTPYFVPDEAVTLALKIAVSRGVSVDVVVPHTTDHILVSLAARAHYQELLEAGVRVHLHKGLMLHSKSLAVDDDLAIIGSGNLDMRSFYLNFELNIVLYDKLVTFELQRTHARYIAESKRITPEQWSRRPVTTKLLEKAVGLMGPLL